MSGIATVALGTLAWCVAATSPAANAAIAAAAAPSSTTTSTTAKPTTTTSTTARPTTTTPTTVKPRPVTTAAPTTRPPATAPAPTAPRVTSTPAAIAPTTATPEARCAEARQWVAEHGLTLPAGWGFRCPGTAIVAGEARWGVACWNCEGNGSSWIAVDIGRIGSSTAALRYVIAHETCHAIDYVGVLGITTEVGADLCAAVHGAPRP